MSVILQAKFLCVRRCRGNTVRFDRSLIIFKYQNMKSMLQTDMRFCSAEAYLTIRVSLPHKVKTQYAHFRSQTEYFVLPCKIPAEISRRPLFFHQTMYIQPFSMYGSGLTRNLTFNGSIYYVLSICTYCLFTWYGSCHRKTLLRSQ